MSVGLPQVFFNTSGSPFLFLRPNFSSKEAFAMKENFGVIWI